MKARIDKDQKVQHSAETEQTAWQIIYREYKSNTAVFKDKYSPLFSEEILSKQSKDSYSLANIFKNIAEANIQFAKSVDTNQSLKLYHYNDAAIACHHGLSVLEKANCNNAALQRLQELEHKICASLNDIQTDMVSVCGGRPELLQSISNKDALSNISKYRLLEQLRTDTQEQLEAIETAKLAKNDSAYIDLTANVFKQVAHGMQDYLAALYGEAEKTLGPPPCDYNVIGLGSMALRQMTPYSDLEFAILTDNENYKQSEDFRVKEYFKNLTHLVHFKVINLGETIMPISSYGFDFKDFVKTAVNFDLGGKTPLGRIDKPYELIQTVDGMVNYLKNDGDKTSHIDKTLLFILQKSCPIYQHSDKDLAAEYQNQANDFLLSKDETNGRPYCENRAVQVLSKGGVELDYTKQTPEEHKTTGNLKQFSFDAYASQGKLFDVKQEIYRMPDRFIYNLGMIHGIQEDSSWDTIDELRERGIINQQGADNLKKALSFATNLRLKTYSHYGYQKDTMDFAKIYEVQSNDLTSRKVEQQLNKALTTVFKLAHEDLQEDGALFQYYYTALALRNSLEDFCKLDDFSQKDGFFNNNTLYQNNANIKAQINSRLLRYEDALKYQLEELEEIKQSLSSNHSALATSLSNIGSSYHKLGDYKKSVEYQHESLEIRMNSANPDLAISLIHMGSICRELGHYDKALVYQQMGLAISQQALDKNHKWVSISLNNLGTIYQGVGDYNRALECMEQALDIRQKSLGRDHPDVGIILGNIGNVYIDLGNYNKALEYQFQVLETLQQALGKDHLLIATNLCNIAATYGKLGKYEKALEYHTQALEIRQKSLDNDHPGIGLDLQNFGTIYHGLGDYKRALEFQTKGLLIRQKTVDKDQVTATILNNIAATYGKLGEYEKALEYHTQALEIRKKLLGDGHLEVAQSLNNISTVYIDSGDYNSALELQMQALAIYENSLLDNNHFDIFTSLNNIGCTYMKLGDYEKALEYVMRALPRMKKSLGDDHLLIARSLHNIANTYECLKNDEEAFQYHIQALNIRKKLLGNDHLDVLQSLNKVLQLYRRLYENDEIAECKQKIDNTLSTLETNSSFTDMPEKAEEQMRVVSYNITADFFDNKDNTVDQHHHWRYRAPFVKVLLKGLYPDIMCLQELSAQQALELHQYFNREGGYKSIFLSQTPSEIETGAIAYGEEVKGWANKFLGASLIGTFINKSFNFIKTGRFWLNENPDLAPTVQDRGETDKGFGNMNTYRAVLWAKVQLEGNKPLYIFNSHYPLSGNNETRFKCAELEMNKIREIAEGGAWVSVGDKNIIPTKDDNEQYNPQTVYDELTKHGKNIIQDGDNHHGPSATWIGYTYDEYKNDINDSGEFTDTSKLDVIVSNLDSSCSFHHHGAFDPVEFRLIALTDTLTEEHNKQRYFASDHALIGGDFVLDNNL